MTITLENGFKTKSLTDRESALRTINAEIDAINNLKDSVALENLTLALDLMQNATGRIIITGMGKSGHIGNKIAASLASQELLRFLFTPQKQAMVI
jgi:arabinose-5-phosphate isomerase